MNVTLVKACSEHFRFHIMRSEHTDYIAIATNTMHKLANYIQKQINIPLIHIADCVADKCKDSKVYNVGLLGTKYTMVENFLVDRLKEIGYNLTYDDKVINHISKKAIEQKEYGARPILRIIQDEIEDKVTDIILSDEDTRNIKITIGDNNEVVQI